HIHYTPSLHDALPIFAERIKEDIASQRVNQRYPSTIKTLTVDIPENRFIKSIITMMLKRLQRLEAKVRDSEVADTEQRFSAVFRSEEHTSELQSRFDL